MTISILMHNLSPDFNDKKKTLHRLLLEKSYKRGDFKLSSGKKSNHYLNCKPVSLNGFGLQLISQLFLELMDPESKAVAGLTLGADPLVSGLIVVAANQSLLLDALIIRKEIKNYGTKSGLEGPQLEDNVVVTVLEDVVTTAGSCLKAIKKLRENNYVVKEVLSIIDREEGGANVLKQNDIQLKSLFNIRDFINK
tara:strand:- start:185 stop:769 length:585 start_codon:yes stop_codon:yes gene_type:complete